MKYKGIAKGKIIELEERLPYSEAQAVSVSVEALRADVIPGSPAAILKVMRSLPDLDPGEIDELERLIRKGTLPVRVKGEFEADSLDDQR